MLLNYGLAVLTGLLLVLIFPRFNFSILAPFVIAPLVYALAREWVPKHRFLLGWTAGIIYWSLANYWIHFVISVHGGLGPVLGAVGFALFVLLRAIPMGIFSLCAGVVVQRPYAVIAVPAIWVAMERIPYLYDYKWLMLGNAGIDMSLPMRLAPVTGVYGLSFLFAMLGTALAFVALRRPRIQIAPLLLLLLLAVVPAIPEPAAATELAVSVQPSIKDRNDWTEPEAVTLARQMDLLTLAAASSRQKPSLVLWPEIPAPLYFFEDAWFREQLSELVSHVGTPTIIGTVARAKSGEPLNSAVILNRSGNLVGRYDKINLVPFGEYTPWPFRGIVDKVSKEIGDFVPGNRLEVFPAGSEKVGAFICYESAFPNMVREFSAKGATILANLSNDGYFGGSAAREQHLSLVRMRAAENRRWILRSTNDGITAAIDPSGTIAKTLPQYISTSGQLPFRFIREQTFYTRNGDWFAWTCCGIGAAFLLLSQVPTFRRGQ